MTYLKKETGINSYVKATIKPKFHAEEAEKEMAQVRELKEEIQKLENKKAELAQDKEKAENDVKNIKDIDKVKRLNNEIKENIKKITKKRQEKPSVLKEKNEKQKYINEYQVKLDKLLKTKNYDKEVKRNVENQLDIARGQLKKIENKLEKIDDEIKELRNQNKKNSEVVRNENKKIAKYGPKAKALVEALEKTKKDITDNEASINAKTAAKNQIEVYKDNGGIDLEGDLSYKTESAVFGVNSVLNVPFSNTYIKGNGEITKDFATLIKSTHTAYFGVSDVLSGGLSVQHSYKGEDAMKYVSAKLDGKYAVSNDLDLVGKFRFKYQFNGEIDFKNEYLGNKDLLSFVDTKWNVSPLTYIHMYSLGLNYRKTLNITGFVGHGYEKTKKLNYLNYGLMADVKYTGIDKLTLKANATLSGLNVGNKYIGLFEFGANAKYDFNATDKFTVSPELDANVKFKTKEKAEDVKFVVTPKVSVKYVPVNGLTLSGSVGVPVTVMNSAYESTSIKTNLNIRYEW